MLIKLIILPLIPLAISFGIGYWLLISAEGKTEALKIIGKILGGVVIVMTIIAISVGYYALADFTNRMPSSVFYRPCPIKAPMLQHNYHHHGMHVPPMGK